MSAVLLVALAATLPVAVLAWVAAVLIERAGAGLRLRSAAWSVALVLPVLAAGFVVAASLQGKPVVTVQAPQAASAPAVQEALILVEAVTATKAAREAVQAPLAGVPLSVLLLVLLAVGAAFRFGLIGVRLAALGRRILASEPYDDPAAARSLGLGQDQVRLADVRCPMLVGIGRPTILVPRALSAELRGEQIVAIGRHELAHFGRRDHLTGLAQEILGALLWFNPVWSAIRARCLAVTEEACDRLALSQASPRERRAYAETLLAAYRHAGGRAYAPAFTGALARRRILAILQPREKSSMIARVIALPLLGLAVGAAGLGSLALAAEPKLGEALDAPTPIAVAALKAALPAATLEPVVPIDAAPQPGRPAPIEYRRVDVPPPEKPLVINCTLNAQGRATDCAAAEPDREPERTRQTIARIQSTAWPMGHRQIGWRAPEGTGLTTTFGEPPVSRMPAGAEPIFAEAVPGPASFRAFADGRLRPQFRTVVRPTGDSAASFQRRLAQQAAMDAVRQATTGRPLKDEAGREVGTLGRGARLNAPVVLRSSSGKSGTLSTDAEGRLLFDGRLATDRVSAVPVYDAGGVIHLRDRMDALQPGDKALLPFAPILADESSPAAGLTFGVSSISLRTPITCIITAAGRATDCAVNPQITGERRKSLEAALPEIRARAWPVDPAAAPGADGRRSGLSPGRQVFFVGPNGEIETQRRLVTLGGRRLTDASAR